MKVQSIYTSKILKKGLEFAADRSALFVASTSLVLSTVARPIAIMSTPKTDLENKKHACTKSLASSAIGYLIMLCASLPVSKAIKNIEKKPEKYLSEKTINIIKSGEKNFAHSKKFNFISQFFNLGLGFIIAVPKSILTCELIPPLMSKIFPNKENKDISFTGHLSKGFGKLIETKPVQKLANKFSNTNYEQHIMSLTDALATGTFIFQTSRSKKIKEERKKALMYNSAISTGLCISAGYLLNKILEKPTRKFIEKFSEANKNSLKLDKYIKGIKVVKPALILGGIYYIAIPIISTFLADRFEKNKTHSNKNNV